MITYPELLAGWFKDLRRRLAHRRMLKRAEWYQLQGYKVEFIGSEAGFSNVFEVPAVPMKKVLSDPYGGYTFRMSPK